MPVPMTENSKTVSRGSRFWKTSRTTTPAAAPMPSAVISTPNVALSPPSTSVAKTGPSGIIAPPPMSPSPRPMITPRTSGSLTMNRTPSLMSRNVARQVGLVLRGRGRRRDRQAQDDQRGDEERRRVDPQRERLLVDLQRVERGEGAQPRGERGEQREDQRRERERAVRRDERQRVRGRELVVVDEVRHRRVLRRTPQQRQDLEQKREHDEPGRLSTRTGAARAAPRARCRTRTITLAAVEPVDDDAADRREEEPRQHAGQHHEARPRRRVVRDLGRDGEDREEADPVAEARDDLGDARAGRTSACRTPATARAVRVPRPAAAG